MNVNLKQLALTKAAFSDIHLRELLRGASTNFVIKIAGMITGYLSTLLIVKKFGADTLGIYSISIALITITSWLGRLGLGSGLLKFVAAFNSQNQWDSIHDVYKKSVGLVLCAGIILSLSLFLLSPWLAHYIFGKDYLSIYFRIAAIGILPISLVELNATAFRGLKKIREFSFFSFVSYALFALLLLAPLSMLTIDAKVPLFAYLGGAVLAALLSQYFWSMERNRPLAAGEKIEKTLTVKNILMVSLPMLFAGSMQMIMTWTDTLMLGMFSPEKDVGIYSVVMKIAILPSFTLFAINSIAAPRFAELYAKGQMKELAIVARHSTKLIFWSSVPVMAVILAFPSFLLGIFGEEFMVGKLALILLLAGNFINSISGSVAYILMMTGREKIFQFILLAGAMINVGLNVMLIPRYGINGAAFASMVSLSFWNLAAVIYIKQQFSFTTIYLPILLNKK